MEKETEDKISQLGLLEQNMHKYLNQKQSFQAQLMEIESALSELKSTKKAYKIVGNIMVSAERALQLENLSVPRYQPTHLEGSEP
jgi:chaperonin cofactor prefoldin